MRSITLTPEALNDIEGIKEHIVVEFGTDSANKITKAIFKDIKLFERFGIETDYKCIYSNKNYVFYRLEGGIVRIIRVLNEKRDFLYVLLGIRMRSDESEEYWGE